MLFPIGSCNASGLSASGVVGALLGHSASTATLGTHGRPLATAFVAGMALSARKTSQTSSILNTLSEIYIYIYIFMYIYSDMLIAIHSDTLSGNHSYILSGILFESI